LLYMGLLELHAPLVNEMLGRDFFGVSQAEASGFGECREPVSKGAIIEGQT
jgi:hypothetical protein